MNNVDGIPKQYLDPITFEIMKDPVIMPDGHTYERESIRRALAANPISPMTRQPMKFEDARPDYTLKSLIDDFCRSNSSMEKISRYQSSITSNGRDDMQVFVKNLNGSLIIEHVNDKETVSSFKYKIQKFTGVPPNEQWLLYAGKNLTLDLPLKEYGIHENSTVQLLHRVLGGIF